MSDMERPSHKPKARRGLAALAPVKPWKIARRGVTATARADRRRARASQARLIEELGQRLTAIGLAVQVLKRGGANPMAIKTIEVALEEAKQELKRVRGGGGG